MHKFIFIFLGVIGLCHADTSNTEAKAFVEAVLNEGHSILDQQNLSDTARDKKFSDALVKNFAIDHIVKHVLGTNFRKLNEKQLLRFTDLYQKRLIDSYGDEEKIKKFRGMKHEMHDKVSSRRSAKIVVTDFVPNSGGQKSVVKWEVISVDGKPKIADVIIEGISQRQTGRSEYASVFSRHSTIDKALDFIAHKTD